MASSRIALAADAAPTMEQDASERRAARASFRTVFSSLSYPNYRLLWFGTLVSQSGDWMDQMALNWLVCKGTVPIPGAKNRAQADENAGAIGWRLSEEDVQALGRVAKRGQRRLMHRVWQHG